MDALEVRLSVIVPVYNAEKYLEDCLVSILAQEFKDYEVLMIDDQSTDGSWKIMEAYEKKDPRFHAMKSSGWGVSVSRNDGLLHAKGGVVTFVDADDSLPVGTFAEAMSLLEDPSLSFVMGSALRSRGTKDELFGPSEEDLGGAPLLLYEGDGLCDFEKKTLSNGEWSGFPLNHAMTSMVWGKYYRAEVLRDHYFETELSMGEDVVFLLDVIRGMKETGGTVGVSPHVWYNYEIREGSLTGTMAAGELRKNTEKFLGVLYERYGGDDAMRPYLAERFSKQLGHLIDCNVSMQDPSISRGKKSAYLKKMLERSPWKDVLCPGCEKDLPGNAFDKGLAFCAGHGMTGAALAWAGVRQVLKK